MEEIKVDGYKKYKGAVGKAHKKSRFKRMGLSSAIVMEEGIAISSSYTSMARNGMKVPNIEIMTSEDGESVYKTNLIALRDFEVDAEKVRLCGEDEEIEIDNPSRLRHDDYSGIRQALEKKYFGAEFPGDNLHVQIAYRIADIKKHLICYMNQIVYIFFNINRNAADYESYTDIIGTVYAFSDYDTLCASADTPYKQEKLEGVKKLLNGAYFYNAYFPGVFKVAADSADEDERLECDRHNYNVFRLLSVIRQACEHENLRTTVADALIYDTERALGKKCEELLRFLDDLYRAVSAGYNERFAESARNNLYVLSVIYPKLSEEYLMQSYYSSITLKEQNNIGLNVKLIKEIIIDRYIPEWRHKRYDGFRSKLYTVACFIINEAIKGSALASKAVIKLRKNQTETGRLFIYSELADEIWDKSGESLMCAGRTFVKESRRNFSGEMDSADRMCDRAYTVGKTDISYFSKLVLLMTRFLDGNETNELICGLISRLDNIDNLVLLANECKMEIDFCPQYSVFATARRVSEELKKLRVLAGERKELRSVKNCMLVDAAKILGIGAENGEGDPLSGRSADSAILSRMYGSDGDGKDKSVRRIRNFIINSVVKSRHFQYIAKYTKPSVCRKIMSNERLVSFAVSGLPDEQVTRCFKSVMGFDTEETERARAVLTRRICGYSIERVFDELVNEGENEYREGDKTSLKAKNIALTGLYLSVAYTIIKNIVKVNSVFNIAFSCLERDIALKGMDSADLLSVTAHMLYADEEKVSEYNGIRDGIRDNRELNADEKRNEYKSLVPILKKMHFGLKEYYCVRANYQRTREICHGKLDISRGYRNYVTHMNATALMDRYIGEMQEISSYFSVFVYCLQRYIVDEGIKNSVNPNDKLSQYLHQCYNRLLGEGRYNRSMLWIMNVPFAYNMARYKNLSIEDLFYGRRTDEKLYQDDARSDWNIADENGAEQSEIAAERTECFVGEELLMTRAELTARGGLRGYAERSEIKINVSPKQLLGMKREAYIGKSIRVRVIGWDIGAGVYNAEICVSNEGALSSLGDGSYKFGDRVIADNVTVTQNKGLRGVIRGSTHVVGVSAKLITYEQREACRGKSIEVEITAWDKNASVYNARLIGVVQ